MSVQALMTRNFVFGFVLSILAIGCRESHVQKKSLRVTDVTHNATFDLTPTNKDMYLDVSGVWIHFQGYLDGPAYFVANGYDTQTLSGQIDFVYSRDVTATNYT